MSNTLADLLKKLNVVHKLNKNDPLLFLPLSQFNKKELPDLITLVWLHGEGWIDPSKVPNPHKELADMSKEHVEQFYNSIRREVRTAISESKEYSDKGIKTPPYPILSVPPSLWVNSTQVTLYATLNTTYKKVIKLSHCNQELSLFQKFIEHIPFTSQEENRFSFELDDMLLSGAQETRKKSFACALKRLDQRNSWNLLSILYFLYWVRQKQTIP